MNDKQQVNIKEYFLELTESQSIEPRKDRMVFAKAYIHRTNPNKPDNLSIVDIISKNAESLGVAPMVVVINYAFKELNMRIEEDLIDYVREIGFLTYDAMKSDLEEEAIENDRFKSQGWRNCTVDTAVKELDKQINLEIVSSSIRPIHCIPARKNMFNFDNLSLAPVKPKEIKDWDNMSEAEWQAATDDQIEYYKALYANNSCQINTNKKEALYLDNTEEFPDFVHNPT